MIRRLFLSFALLLAATTAQALEPSPLKGKVFGEGPTLVVMLHGDVSRGGAADYLYSFADRIAGANAGVTAVALLRPGYYDDDGQTSPGSNTNRRDHYTSENNALVAETIRSLRADSGATKVIAMGHSGGAAQLGAIMGKEPGLIDTVVLVSCPCDVPAWRKANGRKPWRKSESPQDFVGSIAPSSRVIAVTGSRDNNTASAWGIAFVKAAAEQGAYSEFFEVSGAKHGFRGLSDKVAELITAEVAR